MTLGDLFDDAAANLPGVDMTIEGGSRIWSAGGHPFAVLGADGSAAEFALEPVVAGAAARTPDVSASNRGPGWVVFRPSALDDHAIDRARAWFESAFRRAHR
jgi:transcription elongation factor